MQEEVASKTIALTAKCTKITARVLVKMFIMFLQHQKNKKLYPNIPQGKQTVKELAKQGQGMTSLDLNNDKIKLFEKTMKKYGVDYAIMTNKKTIPPTHTLFFKAKDADAITSAFKEYTISLTKKREQNKPSIIEKLKHIKTQTKEKQHKQRQKQKAQTKSETKAR